MQTLAMRYLERYVLVRKGSWAPLPLLAWDLSNVKSKWLRLVCVSLSAGTGTSPTKAPGRPRQDPSP